MVLIISGLKKRPEEAFTPRGEFNPRMYTPRTSLESDFRTKLRQSSHLVLYGESGCGKSWLYRSFFSENAVTFKIVNLADASRNGKITPEILRAVDPTPGGQLTGYDTKKSAGGGVPFVANASLEQTNKYTVPAEDPLRSAIRLFRSHAGAGAAFLVFDNLERIFEKPALMEELADIITLADDDGFLQHKVRFLIVGVPSGVREYFARTPSHRTVSNRLLELQEVSRMTQQEAETLVVKGFEGELEYKIEAADRFDIIRHIEWATDRIPQAMQEYCLQLAFVGEATRTVTKAMLEQADDVWLKSSLSSAYTVVEGQLNERDTRVQRRNQVLYALGRMDGEEFKAAQVEAKVRALFYPNEPSATIGGVPNALSELALTVGSGAVLRKTPKGDAYMFLDPQYRMCIRVMLKVGANNAVEKLASSKI